MPRSATSTRRSSAAGWSQSLIELVKMRASQINGCAFCLDMHSKDARKHGETEQRLYLLNAWRETPYYSDRERAALAWTECLTRLSTDGAPDAAYRALEAHLHPGRDRQSHRAHRRDQHLEPHRRGPELADAEGGMTETLRHAETDAEIAACFPVMRLLRPHLTSPEELCARVRRQAQAGYRDPGGVARRGGGGPRRLPAAGKSDPRAILLRRRSGGARRSAPFGRGCAAAEGGRRPRRRRAACRISCWIPLSTTSWVSGSISASACCRRRCGSRCGWIER